jgi:hypothetical protein
VNWLYTNHHKHIRGYVLNYNQQSEQLCVGIGQTNSLLYPLPKIPSIINTRLTEPIEDKVDSKDVEDMPSVEALEGVLEEEALEEGETSQDNRSVMCIRNQDAGQPSTP